MALPKVTDSVTNITDQPVRPVISASALQALFDETGKDLKTYLNDSLTVALESITDGSSGADNIGATPISGGTANTVQGIVEELNAKATSGVNALNTHKSSADHDGRYYTEAEVNALLLANQQGNHTGTWQGFSPSTVDQTLRNEITDARTSSTYGTFGTLKLRLDNSDIKIKDLSVNVKEFGATGDGITDDTLAIQNAINSMTNGGVLYFPIGNYLINSSGTECLLVTKPIKFVGAGAYSRIRVKTTTPSTCDVIRISPTIGVGGEGYGFDNLQILPDNFYNLIDQGGLETDVPARHAIHLDCTNPSQYISKFLLNNCVIRNFNGWGLYLTNPVGMDAFFTSTISNNLIYNGLYLNRAGDSLNIVFNTITNDNKGVYIKSVDGAASNIVAFNNITTKLGAIEIVEAIQPKILYNQIEQFENGGVPQIIVGSGAVTIPLAEIVGNNINAKTTWATNNIKVDKAYRCVIDNNNIFKGTSDPILITSNATKTYIGSKNQFEIIGSGEITAEQSVNDSGNGTVGLEKTATLLNSWITEVANNSPAIFYKDENNIVHIKGIISSGLSSIIFTLPPGFRPNGNRIFPIVDNGVFGSIFINSSGTVINQSGSNTRVVLDGINFKVSSV